MLFRGSGKDICDLRLFEKRDGKEVPIDRPSLLGYESSREMPRAVRLLRKPQLESHTRQLCAALHEREGAPVALHGRIRCAGRDKWEKVEDGKRDLCKPKKKRKKKRKKKKKGGAK